MKLGSILLLLWLLIGQTLVVSAELHQSHVDEATVLHLGADDDSLSSTAETNWPADVLDFLGSYDCQHCCHCHNMTPVLALALEVPAWQLPDAGWPGYRFSHISPDLILPKKPPIA